MHFHEAAVKIPHSALIQVRSKVLLATRAIAMLIAFLLSRSSLSTGGGRKAGDSLPRVPVCFSAQVQLHIGEVDCRVLHYPAVQKYKR